MDRCILCDDSFHLFTSLADSVNSDLSGICYAYTDYESSLFSFTSISALQNYTDYLESLYLSNYNADVDTMCNTLTGL